jgi:plasmid stability protein
MKTTVELPDELLRAAKIRAAERNMKLKDLVAEALRQALSTPKADETVPRDPVQALRQRLVFNADGTVDNPDGIDDDDFFAAVDGLREASRREPVRDPFGAD